MRPYIALLLCLAAGPCLAEECPGFPLANIRVIDGDTIQADIHLPWEVTLRGQMIRAADYDAWETTRRRQSVTVTDEEVERGQRAAEDLRQLAERHPLYALPPADVARDNYGRVLARIFYRDAAGDLHRLAHYMQTHDHLRPPAGN